MTRPRMRPRFSIPVQGSAEDARRLLSAALAADGCPVRGGRVGDRFELKLPEEEQHYWSPHLSLVLDDEDGPVILEGRFGPHPHVWTMFVAIYAHIAFLAIGASMYGISQWMLHETPWALWLVPVAGLLAGIVYLSAFYGQGLGSEHMYALRHFVEDALQAPTRPNDAQG